MRCTTLSGSTRSPSKAKQVIETEGAAFAEEPVITEQAAGHVADHHVCAAARRLACRIIEHLAVTPEQRAAARNGDGALRDLYTVFVIQRQISRGVRMPRRRCRVNEMAKRIGGRLAETQKEPRAQAGRVPGVRLRRGLVPHGHVEDVRAEAGLGDVAGVAVFVTKETVQPAVGLAAAREVIHELDVTIAARQCLLRMRETGV